MTIHSYGVLAVAGNEVAFEVGLLREVVAINQALAPLPRSPDWLIGSFTLRGVQIPTVDLARLFRGPPRELEATDTYTVAVLSGREGRFGLLIDHVGDVVNIDSQQLNRLDGAESDVRLFARDAFARPGSDTPVYVLDIEALLDLDGMMRVSDEAGRGARAARTGNYARANSRQRAVVAVSGDLTFAMDADVVREIADCRTLTEPAVRVVGYLGNHRLRADTIPVFDARVVLGQSPATNVPVQMLVLDTGHGRIALAVDHIISMVMYGPQDCLALAGPARQEADSSIVGLLSHAGIPDALMVSHTVLFAREELVNLARVHGELNIDAQRRERSSAAWRRFALLHFEAAGEFVVLIDQLDAVLPMPAEYASLGKSSMFEGVFRHLDHAVTLVDTRALLGRKTGSLDNSQVLVVDGGAGHIGFIVDTARDIEYIEAPSDSLHVHRRGSDNLNATVAERHHCLTSIGVGERKQYLSLICLEALAAELLGAAVSVEGSICAHPVATPEASSA